jgi:NADH dehydrogenase [ubiquinone] 1 alpha subcomplex assembly factor 7
MSSAEDSDEISPLLAKLRARIEREGPLPVDAYMQACLGDAEHGYWQRSATIGTGGDFITAPEISQVFGELIGLWCAVVWQSMGSPAPLRLVELGPGRGTLMRDILRAGRAMPAFLAAASVHLVETSAPLRAMQAKTLASTDGGGGALTANTVVSLSNHGDAPAAVLRQAPDEVGVRRDHSPPTPSVVDRCLHGLVPIEWHGAIEEVPEGAAIVIANEFLDVLPIRQLAYAEGAWRERVVDVDGRGGLQFAAGAEVTVAAGLQDAMPAPGAILELRAGEDELLARLARRAPPLVALFVDYGPAQAATGDTLQAVRRHTWVDPLNRPGSADLTAHVQFAQLALKARTAGLAADGPITQAEFLGRLGVAERAARLMASNPKAAENIESGVQRLMSPTGMGELFKVLAVRSPGLLPPPPFV